MKPSNEHRLNVILKAVNKNLLTLTKWEESFIESLDKKRNFDVSWKQQKILNKLFNKVE